MNESLLYPVSLLVHSTHSLEPNAIIDHQALLSERITDCHVQNFSLASTGENEATNELDTSHINYRQAVAMVTQSKEQLSAEIALRRSLKDGHGGNNEENMGATSDEIIKAEVNALNDLYNEATLALARILTKQAGVCAMLNNHYEALVRCCNIS